jgi:hypothetical protein
MCKGLRGECWFRFAAVAPLRIMFEIRSPLRGLWDSAHANPGLRPLARTSPWAILDGSLRERDDGASSSAFLGLRYAYPGLSSTAPSGSERCSERKTAVILPGASWTGERKTTGILRLAEARLVGIA